jgi:hypothetical protein
MEVAPDNKRVFRFIPDGAGSKLRTVYVRHLWAPFAGWMAAADTAFTIPAFIRVRGRRIHGYVEASDGLAFQQDHAAPWFVAYKREVTS